MGTVDSRKTKIHQAVQVLHNLRGTPEGLLLQQLLSQLLEDSKDHLVSSNPQEFLREQGKAVAYRDLLRMILRGKPEIMSKREE